MVSAPLHEHEIQRLEELLRYDVLDSEDEAAFDELTELASNICGTPVSLISLIDSDRQWFKSRVGIDAHETPRELAFCAHAILQPEVFEVPNALEDERFADNPLVTGDPDIRFYAGAPLVTEKGLPIGTLCVIDKAPRHLTDQQKKALEILAKQVIGQLELRVNYKKLQRVDREREKIFSVIGHDLRSPFTGILGLSRRLYEKADSMEADKVKTMAGGILTSSLQVFQVLDELMQWTQQRLGRTHSQPTLCHVANLAQESIDLLQVGIGLKQLNCVNNIDPNVTALADAAIGKTIFRNLLANAIKYSPDGSDIVIDAQTQDNDVVISIQDQGLGIPKDLMSRLFKDSVEGTEGTAGESSTGIGLSLCGELIATQNGRIWVDENYDQGARIFFSFPTVAP
ncbi:MAG: GAF domain-containing sensor histidine kinase [Gammaproteobacteria bacterium]|nr:GAF domain-containing sensor histidine kinase [Gammaproteobacteria bacterium]